MAIPVKGAKGKEAVTNLGITWSVGTDDVFEDHVRSLLIKHGNGLRLVLPMYDNIPLPKLLQMHNAFCLGPWIHSMPVILGHAKAQALETLDRCQAQGLKQLAAIASSAPNMATIFELGSRSFACLAMGRVTALREQLTRIKEQARESGNTLPAVELGLKYLERTYSNWSLVPPTPTSRIPVIWDAPHIDVRLMHLFPKLVFLADHDLTKSQQQILADDQQSEAAKRVKREANQKRLDKLKELYTPAVWGYGDGSVRATHKSGERQTQAATAANLYEGDEADPTFQYRKAAPSNSSSFTAEMRTVAALGSMLDACEPPAGCKKAIFILDSLSKVKQLAKGPVRVNDATAAKDLARLLRTLATGKVETIVIAHLYSHTAIDARMEKVDQDAKSAATVARATDMEDAPHWWKDDARTTLHPWLKARATELLRDQIRGKYGPAGPSPWSSKMRGLTYAQERRLAQLRVGCCSGLGGHLHGLAHAAVCGLCGKQVGRTLSNEEKIQSPVEHLFTCKAFHELRTESEIKSMTALWTSDPLAIMAFFDKATEMSRQGQHARGDETVGANWAPR